VSELQTRIPTRAEVIAWCDAHFSAETSELEQLDQPEENTCPLYFSWEGGGDSGEHQLHSSLEENDFSLSSTNSPVVNFLLRRFDEVLDYQSWDGGWYAHGEAHYNPATKTFEGISSESEDDFESFDFDFTITIPAEMYFEQLEIGIQDEEEWVHMSCRNGFETPAMRAFVKKLQARLVKTAKKVLNQAADGWNYEVAQEDVLSGSWVLRREEFSVDEAGLSYTLPFIDLRVERSTSCVKTLDLNDEAHYRAEAETDELNKQLYYTSYTPSPITPDLNDE
jgi:hypothetical protein